MGVLMYWSDERVAAVAERLGTPTPSRRDDVRRVLNEANAMPCDLYRRAVSALVKVAEMRSFQPGDGPDVARTTLANLNVEPFSSAPRKERP